MQLTLSPAVSVIFGGLPHFGGKGTKQLEYSQSQVQNSWSVCNFLPFLGITAHSLGCLRT